jgi:hypothetical protein
MIEQRLFRTIRKVGPVANLTLSTLSYMEIRRKPFPVGVRGLKPRYAISNDWKYVALHFLLHIKALCHLGFTVTPGTQARPGLSLHFENWTLGICLIGDDKSRTITSKLTSTT